MKSENTGTTKKSEGLTYAEAMDELKQGNSVKLPEWGGIWFPINNKIWVFTKYGEILDTPDHDQYGRRNDWTLSVGVLQPELPIDFVRALRKRADNTLKYIKTMIFKDRETDLATTSMQLGFMWLGLYLNELGAENPYPKSSDHTSPVIEEHADKATADHLLWLNNSPDQIAIVKGLRAEIQLTIDFLKYIADWRGGLGYHNGAAMGYFIETKMWMGQELNNIRERNIGNTSIANFSGSLHSLHLGSSLTTGFKDNERV